MKKYWYLLILTLYYQSIAAQPALQKIDSLKRELEAAHQDTTRLRLLLQMSTYYIDYHTDSAIFYARQSVTLAKRIKDPEKLVESNYHLAYAMAERNIPASMAGYFQIIRQLQEKKENKQYVGLSYYNIGRLYGYLGNNKQAILFYHKARNIFVSDPEKKVAPLTAMQMGFAFLNQNQLDSCRYYLLLASKEVPNIYDSPFYLGVWGMLEKKHNYKKANIFFRKSIYRSRQNYKNRTHSLVSRYIAEFYLENNQVDSAVYYGREGYEAARRMNFFRGAYNNSRILSEAFAQKGNIDSAYKYLVINNTYRDGLFSQQKFNSIQSTIIEEQQRLQNLKEEKRQFENWVKIVAALSVAAILLIFSLGIFFSKRKTQKANILLQRQRDEISQQRLQLQRSLEDLQSTQTQLIQKEKLASLGELTAGIAHEIQNPLNFVNNYSEVNMELIEELQEEAEKGDTEEIRALLTDLSDNERKIHHHGRRADAIVRGMLEHARATPGEKQPTDLNALADEYLRLAYHGLRAKDSAFQCELVTDFDPNLGKVAVAPSELGRVLLNLFNNAFYAVRQRQLVAADQAYTPTVWVSTHRLYEKVEIEVRDNGTGMPPEVQAKIFQPFFTTKPTGEGTGLGLSLSYDIVTKGHGGALRVESKVGEGTEFVVELPFG